MYDSKTSIFHSLNFAWFSVCSADWSDLLLCVCMGEGVFLDVLHMFSAHTPLPVLNHGVYSLFHLFMHTEVILSISVL